MISSLSSDFHIFTPSCHWTCSLVCYLNSTESIQSCSHFGALNLSYTLPVLSHQVLIFTWVNWSIWRLSALPKGTTSKQCHNVERGEHDISLKILHQAGFETACQEATLSKLSALTVVSRPSLRRRHIRRLNGPNLVLYLRPIEEWFSMSHDEIDQSPLSFSCHLN